MRGRVPIAVRHELYAHPSAPVIRTILHIYDRPATPLALEVFTNITDMQQREEFVALSRQASFLMLFYDEQLAHRVTKVVPQDNPAEVTLVVSSAERLLARIPTDQVDFDRAKDAVQRRTHL